MGLKEGSLQSLILGGAPTSDIVFYHMLQALDYLAVNGIIHRDVKPENILYVTLPNGDFHFQLGDFGLCNTAARAYTEVGTRIFMAPEIQEGGKQTHKVDVWSLFVTMLWMLNVRQFRSSTPFKTNDDVNKAILDASNEAIVVSIRPMAIVNPEERASAAQMLVELYNGNGLSTPRNQVLALHNGIF